jgi:hypothetical protein
MGRGGKAKILGPSSEFFDFKTQGDLTVSIMLFFEPKSKFQFRMWPNSFGFESAFDLPR